jgi:two-component system cell cycle sensor histidine kinase/response regulator CckA
MVQPLSAITDPVELRRRSEMMLRMAGNLARFGGWSLDVDTGTNFWSDELCLILGFPPGAPPPVEVAYSLYPDEDRRRITSAMEECGNSGTPFDQVRRIHHSDGRLLTVRVVGEPLRDADGRISHIEGAFHDITEQEEDRAARVAVEERLATTLDSLTDGLLIFDQDWKYTYVNPRAQELLGVDLEAMIGKVFWEVAPGPVQATFGAAMRTAMEEKRTTVAREYHPVIDRWLEATAYPSPSGTAVYLRDVSAEEEIRRDSAAKAEVISGQAALLDVARDAIIVRNLDQTIAYWNHAAAEMYGWSASEAVGASVRDLIYTDPAAFDVATAAVMRDGQWSGDIRQRTKDGRDLIAECSWTLVRDESGEPKSIFAVNTDVTVRRREAELNLRRQRMESLGTLAGGVAHDLNNVLAPLLLGIQLLLTAERDERHVELLHTMESSVKRGADMIGQVLSFARGVQGERVTVDVAKLLDELRSFGREALPSNIRLEVSVPDDLWHTIGDTTQLLQVLVNLMTNARDAMPDGGNLAISARNTELDQAYPSVSHLAPPGRYIAIDVEDDGSGMTADVVSKAFEPFFTTKEQGHGTGLGLASSLAIVRAHGGYMQVYSEPGRGSRFHLRLPATDDQFADAPLSQPEVAADKRLGHGETVLVVDDEIAVRELTQQTLETFGYLTVSAGNGVEALDLLSNPASHVDLVLTDMMMPIMDGAALASELSKSHPGLPIIAASGLNANGGVARARDSGVRHFLSKPFTSETLLKAVEECLAGDESSSADG